MNSTPIQLVWLADAVANISGPRIRAPKRSKRNRFCVIMSRFNEGSACDVSNRGVQNANGKTHTTGLTAA